MWADMQELLQTASTLTFPKPDSCDFGIPKNEYFSPLTFSESIKHLHFQADACFLLSPLIMAWHGAYVNFVDCRFFAFRDNLTVLALGWLLVGRGPHLLSHWLSLPCRQVLLWFVLTMLLGHTVAPSLPAPPTSAQRLLLAHIISTKALHSQG